MKDSGLSSRSIIYNCNQINFFLERKQVKNLNLRIRKDGTVYVSANENVPICEIDAFVLRKGAYILEAVNRFHEIASNTTQPKQYVSGESFILQGRNLRLLIHKASDHCVITDGIYIHLYMEDTNDYNTKKRLITNFLNDQRRTVFEDVLTSCYPMFRKYGISYPELRIREMVTRWGSCSVKKGIITLNAHLIEAPRNCIEYVVIHEYCHFIHPDHSKRFYTFLTMVLPDWRERKQVLDKYADYWL